MAELIKSYRMYKFSINGLPYMKVSTHVWAWKNVKEYRLMRMQILR